MAKSRKKAAKRGSKRKAVKAKAKSKAKARKAPKRKVKRKVAKPKNPLVAAVDAVVGTVEDTTALHRQMGGKNNFED